MNIAELLGAQARERPDAPALIDGRGRRNRIRTYSQLDTEARQLVTLLQGSGLQMGDTVLVLQPMSIELYVVLVAIFRMGLVAMFLDPSAGRDHIEECFRLREPRALIASTTAHLLRLRSSALRRIPVKFSIGFPLPGATSLGKARGHERSDTMEDCSSDTPALVTFTSGSAGKPKAVLRTHGFLMAQHRALEQALDLKAGEVDLSTQPIFVLANLASGVTSIIPDADMRRPGAIDAAPVVLQALAHQATRSAAAPIFFERLIDYCEREKQQLSGLQKIYTGGGPVSPVLLDGLAQLAPCAEVTIVYGSTEAEPIASVSRRDIGHDDFSAIRSGRGLLVGRPVPFIELKIMKDRWGSSVGRLYPEKFDDECQPVGEAGEIVVSGEHVLSYYLDSSVDEGNKFDVGQTRWHRTGDAGFLDGQGRLWLLGRCSARIEDHEGLLYPFCAEQAALQHPFVRYAAVVSLRGQRVLAIETYDHIVQESRRRLLLESVKFSGIEELHLVQDMPVDNRHNSKIDYPRLKKLLGANR